MSDFLSVIKNSMYYCILAGIAGICCLALQGCAASKEQGAQAATRPDLVTESDEPEARRRARIRLALAAGYFEQGQPKVALDELKQSIAIDPTWSEAYNLRGLIYMGLNETKLAEESFKRALQISPRESNYLHNYGWLACQDGRYAESFQFFTQTLSDPAYSQRAKTLMTQGLCQLRAGLKAEAEVSFLRSYELDAGNPVTGYNLALLLFQRGDFTKAQFYVRRLNNSELANAESLWLGVRVERMMGNLDAMRQLAEQLKKRYPQSREAAANDRGRFDE